MSRVFQRTVTKLWGGPVGWHRERAQCPGCVSVQSPRFGLARLSTQLACQHLRLSWLMSWSYGVVLNMAEVKQTDLGECIVLASVADCLVCLEFLTLQ